MQNHIEIALPTQPSVYEQYADQEEKAIASQRRIYEAKFPPPPEPRMTDRAKFVVAGFGIIFAAAVIVSGAHTIPLFQRSVPDYNITDAIGININLKNIVGVAAFVMIEMAMIILTYSRITHYTSAQRDTWQRGVRLITRFIVAATAMVFVVALFANIYSTLTLSHDAESSIQEPESIASLKTTSTGSKPAALLGIELPDVSDIAEISLFVLMGASAPVLTLLCGEIIGHTLTVENATNDRKREKHAEDMKAYNQSFNEYYESKKGRGVWKVGVTPEQTRSSRRNGHAEKSDVGELTAIYIDKDRRQCPVCKKIMTRQSWGKHPCRDNQ